MEVADASLSSPFLVYCVDIICFIFYDLHDYSSSELAPVFNKNSVSLLLRRNIINSTNIYYVLFCCGHKVTFVIIVPKDNAYFSIFTEN